MTSREGAAWLAAFDLYYKEIQVSAKVFERDHIIAAMLASHADKDGRIPNVSVNRWAEIAGGRWQADTIRRSLARMRHRQWLEPRDMNSPRSKLLIPQYASERLRPYLASHSDETINKRRDTHATTTNDPRAS